MNANEGSAIGCMKQQGTFSCPPAPPTLGPWEHVCVSQTCAQTIRQQSLPFSPNCWAFLPYGPPTLAAAPAVQRWCKCQLIPEEVTLPCLTSTYLTLSRTSVFLASFFFFLSLHSSPHPKKDWRGIHFQLCRKRKRAKQFTVQPNFIWKMTLHLLSCKCRWNAAFLLRNGERESLTLSIQVKAAAISWI